MTAVMALDAARPFVKNRRMHPEKQKEFWPRWSTWALVAVVLTTLLTVAATLNDIY